MRWHQSKLCKIFDYCYYHYYYYWMQYDRYGVFTKYIYVYVHICYFVQCNFNASTITYKEVKYKFNIWKFIEAEVLLLLYTVVYNFVIETTTIW